MTRILVFCVGTVVSWGCSQKLVGADYRFSLEGKNSLAQGLKESDGGASAPDAGSVASGCSASALTCTPDNLEGRIFSGGVMWGELGPAGSAENVTLIGETADVILDPSKGRGGVLEFSLKEATTLASQHWAPPADAPEKPLERMEFNFDYLDATFELVDAGALNGRYVIRTVFVSEAESDDVEGAMVRGDLLVKLPNESKFKWCGDNGCREVRDDVQSVIVQSAIASHVFPGQGNPEYVTYSVPLKNKLRLSGAQLNEANALWTLDFDITNGVNWAQSIQNAMDVPSLLRAFRLSYDSRGGQGSNSQTDISVTLGRRSIPSP